MANFVKYVVKFHIFAIKNDFNYDFSLSILTSYFVENVVLNTVNLENSPGGGNTWPRGLSLPAPPLANGPAHLPTGIIFCHQHLLVCTILGIKYYVQARTEVV